MMPTEGVTLACSETHRQPACYMTVITQSHALLINAHSFKVERILAYADAGLRFAVAEYARTHTRSLDTVASLTCALYVCSLGDSWVRKAIGSSLVLAAGSAIAMVPWNAAPAKTAATSSGGGSDTPSAAASAGGGAGGGAGAGYASTVATATATGAAATAAPAAAASPRAGLSVFPAEPPPTGSPLLLSLRPSNSRRRKSAGVVADKPVPTTHTHDGQTTPDAPLI